MNLCIIYILVGVELCAALPIPSRSFGERNAMVLGFLSFVGIGALIGMCAFCRKKKGQFEKFENDGHNHEIPNTEYPILKSLNPLDARKSVAIVPSSPTNLSTDNLLEQNAQYNTGSLSSQDVDGVENYNLLRFQSEGTSAHAENQNLVEKTASDEDKNSNLLLSTKETNSTLSLQTSDSNSEPAAVEAEDIFLLDSDNQSLTQEFDKHEEEDNPFDDFMTPLTNNHITVFEEHFVDVNENEKEQGHSVLQYKHNKIDYLYDENENVSMKSITSLVSNEANSIEEALRALDVAIEDELCYEDSDDSNYEPDTLDNVIKNILTSETNNDCDSGINTEVDISHMEIVRAEATRLVDDVLVNCQEIVAKINRDTDMLLNNTDFDDTDENCETDRSTENFKFEHDNFMLPLVPNAQSKDVDYEGYCENYKSAENLSFDNFAPSLESSTPYVSKVAHYKSDINKNVVGSLFSDSECLTKTDNDAGNHTEGLDIMHDTSQMNKSQVINATFDVADTNLETFIHNATFDCPTNQTFTALPKEIYCADKNNATITIDSNTFCFPDDNNTLFVTDGDNNKQMSNDSLPTIRIEAEIDDLNIEEKQQTATPMNTPIELQYQTADWDKWITNSRDNNTEQFYTNNFEDGWFLHTQHKEATDEDNDFCAFSYSNEFNEYENKDSTLEQLRKQLTEMLPHAQGFGDPTEMAEELEKEDTNALIHYGIKYGDLDEASNAASVPSSSKNNEVVINYKRTLSPIMEESEDESFCRNNSYYNIDQKFSTSTGCMESFEAMGVTKTLMASNDTLFNFEDTLDDALSPRVNSQVSLRTPTKIENSIFDVDDKIELNDIYSKPNKYSLDEFIPAKFEYPTTTLSDSPEQLKFDFSMEQDSTFTMDEKTCISVMSKDREDERISEISEPNLVSQSSFYENGELNSLLDDDIESIEDDNELPEPFDTCEITNIAKCPTPDENIKPPDENVCSEDSYFFQNKSNLNNFDKNSTEPTIVIENYERLFLKTRNVRKVPNDMSTNSLVHSGNIKISNRSDAKNVCLNYQH